MSKPVNSSRHSFKGSAIASSSITMKPCAGGLTHLVGFGLSVFLISAVLAFLAAPWVHLSWWPVFRRCVSISAAISLWLFMRKIERRSFQSYGFSVFREGKRQLVFGVLLVFSTLALMWGIGLASGAYRLEVTDDRMRLWVTLLGFLPAAALVSVLEELVFRGFILRHFIAHSKALAVIASSALYAIVHVKTSAVDGGLLRELIGLFLLGNVLSVRCLLTAQLYLSVGLHLAFAYGARINKLLIEFPHSSLAWLTGTSRLINGVATWVALAGVAGLMVWWVRSSPHRGGAHEQV